MTVESELWLIKIQSPQRLTEADRLNFYCVKNPAADSFPSGTAVGCMGTIFQVEIKNLVCASEWLCLG